MADDTTATEPTKRGRGRPPGSRTKTAAEKAAATPQPAPKPARRPTTDEKLQEQVAGQLQALGLALAGYGAVTQNVPIGMDGTAVMTHADPIAEALVNVAKTNPKVKAFLTKGVEGSAWLGVLIAVGALGRDIMGNHVGAGTPDDDGPDPQAFTPDAFRDLANLAGAGE